MENTVLVVDPAPATHRFLQTYLAGESLSLAEANDGKSALRVLEDRRVDLVLAALSLPDMSGFDVCEHVKANPCTASVPVIILADTVSRVQKVRGLQLGAADYIIKPIDPSELRARVRSALAARSMQRELEQQNSLLYQLHEFSLKLNSVETLEDIMRTTLVCALSLTYSGRACIMTPDDTGDRLRVAGIHDAADESLKSLTVGIGKWISGRVYRDNAMCLVNEPGQVPDASADDLPLFGATPFISLPIFGEGGPVGVLNVADKRAGREYSEPDVRILRCIAATSAVAIESQQRRLRLDRTQDAALLGLAGLAEWRDTDTGNHLERLREYSRLLATDLQTMGRHAGVIDQKFIDALVRSVPMHDIGKVGIPDNVLLKPGKLTEAEFEIMKKHTVVGANVLRSMAGRIGRDTFLDMACDIAHFHHEKHDGTGYPTGLAGNAIPLAARITAVADVYDALASDRVYRKAWPHEKTVAHIQEHSGSHFDPEIVRALVASAGEFLRLKVRFGHLRPQPNRPAEELVGASA